MRQFSLFLVLLLAACAPMSGGGAIALDGTSWTLSEIGGNAPAPGPTLTLAFAEGHASGFSGCNQYRAPYTVSGSTLTFGPAISTKRACIEEALNRQEVAYLGAFQNVRSFTASGDRLVLHDANGTALLTFVRASA